MWMRTLLLAVLAAGGCFAQNEPAKAGAAQPAEKKFYHLDIVVKEVDSGKTVNARAYSMNVAENERTSTRTGSRLPVPSGGPTVAGKAQFTFIDVGTNIDCSNAREVTQNQLALNVSVEISSVGAEPDAPPTVRQLKWSSPVIVQLRKPTTVFSSDDPTSKRQMQLEITASPIR